MRVVVTGVGGFIGGHVARALLAGGHEVIGCDRLERDAWSSPVPVERADPWALLTRDDPVDAVVHLGAVSATTADRSTVRTWNWQYSRALWRSCVRLKCGLVYASSAATYGDGSSGFHGRQELRALAALRPRNAYAWSKHVFDLFALRSSARGVAPPRWAGIKPFNVYGAGEHHKGGQRSMVGQVIEQLDAGQPIRLFRSTREGISDGEQRRDFVAVEDVVSVVLWMLEQEQLRGIFNVGSGRARSFLELARLAIDLHPAGGEVEFVDMPDELRAHYQSYTCADLRGLRALGYDAPMTELEDGIRRRFDATRGKAVFLDRDGTLIEDGHYLSDPAGVRVLDGVLPALGRLRDAGYALVLISNQSGLGRGWIEPADHQRVHARLVRELERGGIRLAAAYYCPHRPDEGCACRKPGTELLERAVRELDLDLSACWMVGDRPTDALAGERAGCRGSVVAPGALAAWVDGLLEGTTHA